MHDHKNEVKNQLLWQGGHKVFFNKVCIEESEVGICKRGTIKERVLPCVWLAMPPRESHKQPYYMAARRYSWAVRQKQSSAVHTYVRRATASATASATTTTAAVTGKLWSPRSFTCEMQLSSSHLNWKRASTAIWVATCARASVAGTSTTRRCIAVLLTPLPPPPREQ